jgi:rRNA maturation RNase YbeY
MASLSDILFHAEDVQIPPALNDGVKTWVYNLIHREGRTLAALNFIFCSDDFLHTINQRYLYHDDFTDIITFDNSDDETTVEGDVFISVERVLDNSHQFRTAPTEELLRVMAHGVLHLCGYDDKSAKDIEEMRNKEQEALDLASEYIL